MTNLQPRNFSYLSIDALRAYAPSIFSESTSERTSDKYVQIPTINIVQGLIGEGFLPVKAMQSRSRSLDRRNHTKHLIRFRHVDAQANSAGLFPEIVLINSHDGLSSYRLMSGVYRLICSNGLILGDTHNEIRIRHQGDILGNVIEGTYSIIEESKGAIELADTMQAIDLTPEERTIFAESAHILRFGEDEEAVEAEQVRTDGVQPQHLLRVRRHAEHGKNDLWTTFNVVQENTIKGGIGAYTRDANNRRRWSRTREVKSIDKNTSLNRALWTLAERMAELKGAK